MTTNLYMKFETPSIAGVSQVPGHKGEIEVLSWSHSFEQPTSPSGPVESARHANLTFTKYVDSATNELLKYCWAGKQIGQATLTCCRADDANPDKQVEYLIVIMEHVIISNYSISSGSHDVPVENITLDYGTVQYNYKPQKQGRGSAKILSVKHNLETGIVE